MTSPSPWMLWYCAPRFRLRLKLMRPWWSLQFMELFRSGVAPASSRVHWRRSVISKGRHSAHGSAIYGNLDCRASMPQSTGDAIPIGCNPFHGTWEPCHDGPAVCKMRGRQLFTEMHDVTSDNLTVGDLESVGPHPLRILRATRAAYGDVLNEEVAFNRHGLRRPLGENGKMESMKRQLKQAWQLAGAVQIRQPVCDCYSTWAGQAFQGEGRHGSCGTPQQVPADDVFEVATVCDRLGEVATLACGSTHGFGFLACFLDTLVFAGWRLSGGWFCLDVCLTAKSLQPQSWQFRFRSG